MKKLISSLIIGGLLATSVCTYAEEVTSWIAQKATFKVMVRGSEFISENPPIVVEGRTYLPLRAMGEALGVPIDWNEELRQAEVDMSDKKPEPNQVKAPVQPVESSVTSWTAYKATFKVMVRGTEFISENPPIVVEGRTYLPLRALGEVLGVPVDWNEELRQAEVDMRTTVTPTPTPTSSPSSTQLPKTKIGTINASKDTVIDVPLKLTFDETVGINSFDFTLKFDNNVFEFDKIEVGDIVTNPDINFEANYVEETNELKFLFLNYDLEDFGLIKKSGVMATLRLKVKADVSDSELLLLGKAVFGDIELNRMENVVLSVGDISVVQ